MAFYNLSAELYTLTMAKLRSIKRRDWIVKKPTQFSVTILDPHCVSDVESLQFQYCKPPFRAIWRLNLYNNCAFCLPVKVNNSTQLSSQRSSLSPIFTSFVRVLRVLKRYKNWPFHFQRCERHLWTELNTKDVGDFYKTPLVVAPFSSQLQKHKAVQKLAVLFQNYPKFSRRRSKSQGIAYQVSKMCLYLGGIEFQKCYLLRNRRKQLFAAPVFLCLVSHPAN